MPILNYTTKVPAEASIAYIQKILTKHGARQILIENDDAGNVIGIAFRIIGQEGMMAFKLPANIEAVYTILAKNQREFYDDKAKARQRENKLEQAQRVAWRILKDWVEAQMAILETKMVSFDQVFLPYAVTKSGKPLYQEMRESGYLLLGGQQ